ncbi:MAG: thiamine pyrophosphate-dependent enzyme [Elusimicrobiota bacterium]
MYGEGGNHFIHAIRRNPDITLVVHDNMVYGLTKGQASPTSRKGFKTPVQLKGVFAEPFNPLAAAISQNISFAARASCKVIEQTSDILKKAVEHKGFSLVDIFQPCVSFNRLNTFEWFDEHTYYLEDDYKPDSRVEASKRSLEEEKLPQGIFYRKEKEAFEEKIIPKNFKQPVYEEKLDKEKLKKILESKKA